MTKNISKRKLNVFCVIVDLRNQKKNLFKFKREWTRKDFIR